MRATKSNAERLAKRLGATIEDDGGIREIRCMAPPGHHFRAVEVHEVITTYGFGGWCATKREAWEKTIEDLLGGLDPCADGGCPQGDPCPWWAEEGS